MIPQAIRAVVVSFYSPGRKAFVPLLTHEVARRAKLQEDTAKQAIADAREYGWITTTDEKKCRALVLTPKGEKAARTLMQAAEVERSA